MRSAIKSIYDSVLKKPGAKEGRDGSGGSRGGGGRKEKGGQLLMGSRTDLILRQGLKGRITLMRWSRGGGAWLD